MPHNSSTSRRCFLLVVSLCTLCGAWQIAVGQTLECVEAQDYFSGPSPDLQEVVLGPVTITAAMDSSENSIPIDVVECSGDGRLDVFIPSSPRSSLELAKMIFSPNLCSGDPPQYVEVNLSHGEYCILHGLNDAGVRVATATAALEPTLQTLILASPGGIRAIEVEGWDVCIESVCWICSYDFPTPTPTPGQVPDGCAQAGDVYSEPASELPEVDLGTVKITQALLPDGSDAPLMVADLCSDAELDVFVGWSEETAMAPARIHLATDLCGGLAPRMVEVFVSEAYSCTLHGFDDDGVEVAVATAENRSGSQSLLLSSPSGIRFMEIVGNEICIMKICWFCEGVPPTPTPTATLFPSFGWCAEAEDVYSVTATGLHEVDLGAVRFVEALGPLGLPVPLNVLDCSFDGRLDVAIPWTEATANRWATIEMDSTLCSGNPPKHLEVFLVHGNHCILHGFNEAGAEVDTVTATAHALPQVLSLSSSDGIRTIAVEGSEICVIKVCWFCDAVPPTITPTPPEVGVPGGCVAPSAYYTGPAFDLPEVVLGPVGISAAHLPEGTPVLLSVDDYLNDGPLDVFIPWSEEAASHKATIEFSTDICGGNAPTLVTVILQHGSDCLLRGYSDAGDRVAEQAAPPLSTPHPMVLASPSGIRSIEVVGAEIWILEICWDCEGSLPTATPVPTWDPGPGGCVEASTFFPVAVEDLPELFLGPVRFEQATTAQGVHAPLDVGDCSDDGRYDVWIPWSEATASQLAVIEFAPALCDGNAPQYVEVRLAHYNECILHALNDSGVEVDTAVADASSSPQTLVLASLEGIRSIFVEGSEICVISVCWRCVWTPPTLTPTPVPVEPVPVGCVDPSVHFATAEYGLHEVQLGPVLIADAWLPDGTPVPLDVAHCSDDATLDVWIPWSESTAARLARIEFGSGVCDGNPPQRVDVVLRHGNDCVLHGLDDAGTVVTGQPALPHSGPQVLSLFHASGIRAIDIEGSEICLLEICWFCEAEAPTPTPTQTETFTPTPTPTSTYTNTITSTPTSTPKPTDSQTPTSTETPVDTPTLTPTDTSRATETPTQTPTERLTETFTPTPSVTETPGNPFDLTGDGAINGPDLLGWFGLIGSGSPESSFLFDFSLHWMNPPRK